MRAMLKTHLFTSNERIISLLSLEDNITLFELKTTQIGQNVLSNIKDPAHKHADTSS